MKCPSDHIDLVEKQGEGFIYHECPACLGLWMRHRALRVLVKKNNPDADVAIPLPDDAYMPFHSPAYDTNDITKCPVDGADYYEHAFGSVMIDICPKCDGVWMDKGELDKISQELQQNTINAGVLGGILNEIDAFFAIYSGRKGD